jgi:hypothetical protein
VQHREPLDQVVGHVLAEGLGEPPLFLEESFEVALAAVLEHDVPFAFLSEVGYVVYDGVMVGFLK